MNAAISLIPPGACTATRNDHQQTDQKYQTQAIQNYSSGRGKSTVFGNDHGGKLFLLSGCLQFFSVMTSLIVEGPNSATRNIPDASVISEMIIPFCCFFVSHAFQRNQAGILKMRFPRFGIQDYSEQTGRLIQQSPLQNKGFFGKSKPDAMFLNLYRDW